MVVMTMRGGEAGCVCGGGGGGVNVWWWWLVLFRRGGRWLLWVISIWRPPLLFGSILVVASSCLSLWCFECPSSRAFFFLIDGAPWQVTSSVLIIVCWILMGQSFCVEIGSWRLAALLFG